MSGSPGAWRRITAGVGIGVTAAAFWWRRHPSACPYGQRFWVEAPHPFVTRRRLLSVLAPQPGQRLLEVGPGTGYYTLAVARELLPGGQLDIFDLQQQMLDHAMRRAAEAGLSNIAPAQGDARELPYENESFDAAYLVTVLGEVPDQTAALRELERVLRPGGRLVVGELFGDPHWVSPKALSERAASVGLEPTARRGSWIGYYQELRKPPA